MKQLLKTILILIISVFVLNEASAQFSRKKQKKLKNNIFDESGIPRDQDVFDPDTLKFQYHSQKTGISIDTLGNLDLYYKIYEWLGTPYRYGGNTKKGIDCSAFTKIIYETVYHKNIQRDSRSIFNQSTVIPKSELKEGDLVFFRIRRGSVSHVGVYLGENKFVHASTSRGVIISDLREDYYRRYFYKAGRIAD